MKPFYFFGIFLALIASCKKKDTIWKSDWASPLMADTLRLTSLYNDSTLNTTNQTSINVDLTRSLLDIDLSDLLKIPDTTITQLFSPTFTINNVPPGYTFVNSIEEHSIDLEDAQLKKIRVSEGKIRIKVYNPLSTKVYYTIQLPGVAKNGQTFEQTYFVEAGTIPQPAISEEELDLSGYELDLRGESGLNYNFLQSRLSIKTDPNGPAVSISSQYDFKFEGFLSGLKIDYAKGYFGNKIVSDTSSFNIPYLNNLVGGSIDLPSTNLVFSIENGMKVSLKGRILLAENTNFDNNTVSLNSSSLGSAFYISPAIGNWSSLQPTTQNLNFNSSNSNIEQYIENLGAVHKVGYELQLNPWGNLSGGADEIFPNSRIKVKVNLEMPLQISADGLTLRDTFDFNISQDPTKIHANSGIVTLNATNAFPLSCEPKLYFMDDNNFVLYTVLGSAQIASCNMGTFNAQSGLMEKKSTVDFILPSELIADFDKIKFVAVEARFDTPNAITGTNEQQSIPYGAFLAVKLNVKLNGTIIY